jgi:hypothetical protein
MGERTAGMPTRSTALQQELLVLMNRIAEANRRGQGDLAETLTLRAAKLLVEFSNAKHDENARHTSIHSLFSLPKPEK